MRRGRYEQALRDARSALSYVPSSSEWELFDADDPTVNAHTDKSYDDVTKSSWKNSTTTMGEGSVDVNARRANADRTGAKRTHLTTRGVGRVVLSRAGEGGRTEDLVVDSGKFILLLVWAI